MKSLIGAAIAGVILFAGSAGVSWYLVNKSVEDDTDEVASVEGDPTSAFPKPIEDADKSEIMPVAMRPDTPVTVEAVTKLAASIMKKEQAVFDKQKYLQKEEKRLNLLFEDLKREQEELTAFGQKIDAKILLARETTELLKQENQTLTEQTKVLSSLERKHNKTSSDVVDDEVAARVDIVKGWFQKLEAESSAKLLKEFADRGDLEFAGRLLDSLDERQIAKILDAMNDSALVAQIMDAYTNSATSSSAIQKP